jgi:hypothetical protein
MQLGIKSGNSNCTPPARAYVRSFHYYCSLIESKAIMLAATAFHVWCLQTLERAEAPFESNASIAVAKGQIAAITTTGNRQSGEQSEGPAKLK